MKGRHNIEHGNPFTAPVPLEIAQALRAAILMIPGVKKVDVSAYRENRSAYMVAFTGWGPSLHRRHFEIANDLHYLAVNTARTLPDGETAESLFDQHYSDEPEDEKTSQARTGYSKHAPFAALLAVDAIEQYITPQLKLAEYAAGIGVNRPGDLMAPGTPPIGHMLVGRAAMALLLAELDPAEASEHLRDSMRTAYINDLDDMREDPFEITIKPFILPEASMDDEWNVNISYEKEKCTLDMHASLWRDDGTGQCIEGLGYLGSDWLRITADEIVPDVVLAAMAGRPLGDLVETGHEALDAMIVESIDIEKGSGCLVAIFADGMVRLDEHPAMRGHVTTLGRL